MKNLLLVGCLLFALRVGATGGQKAEDSNYVVIGAFASQENADHFVETARKAKFNAQSEINPNRQLFYVYVLHTGNKQQAIEEAQKLRKTTAFWDTWVFSGLLGQGVASSSQSADLHPDTGEKLTRITADDNQLSPPADKTTVTTPAQTATKSELTKNEPVTTTPAETKTAENTPKDSVAYPKAEDPDGTGRHFVFKIYRSSNQKSVEGEVDIVDPEKKKKINSYQGNKDVIVRPINRTGDVSLECEVFGYRKVTHPVNINTPQNAEGVTVKDGQAIVPFELVRLKKGDYAIMYNVYFFKDAAIMKPESRYELNSLRDMMKENPNYKIKIHGHTNGSASGKIIEPGESKDLFSLTGTKDSFGSAMTLSEERAITIYDYLISEGISADRMLVKGWGGKKPIFDKDHPQAQANVRVEIEIISE